MRSEIEPRKVPLRRVTARRSFECDRGRIGQPEREALERHRQSKTGGLDVGLLQRPVLEKRAALPLAWQPVDVIGFRRREVTPRDIETGCARGDSLDVNPHVALQRHGKRDEAGCVRDAETQRRHADRPRDFRPPVPSSLERPCVRLDVRVLRQCLSHERPCHEIDMLVGWKDESRAAHALIG
jgi:hypothetical protein